MGQLEPCNMRQIIKELEIMTKCVRVFCGSMIDIPDNIPLEASAETDEDALFTSVKDFAQGLVEFSLDQLQVSHRRLSVLLNDGDVDMLDTNFLMRVWLKEAWTIVAGFPREMPDVPAWSACWIGRLEDLIGVLKGVRPAYLGGGEVDVNGSVIQFTNRSQIQCLEYLVEHGKAFLRDLRDNARVANPSKTVKELREHEDGALAEYITTPGKSKKGYSTTICDGRIRTIT
jgi:hypothetical protein